MNLNQYNDLRKTQERMVIGEIKKLVPGITPADLEDVQQEVWLRAWDKRDQWTGSALAQTWVGNIARSVTKNWVRGEKAGKRTSVLYEHDLPNTVDGEAEYTAYYDQAGAGSHPSAEQEAAALTKATDIETKFYGLTVLQRRVARMHWEKGLTAGDIAAFLGCKVGTVQSTLATIKSRLD